MQTELTFPEILLIESEKNASTTVDTLYINTVQKEEYVFKSFDAEPLAKLVNYLLQELKKRSIYAVAIQAYTHPENLDTYLKLLKGDLITMDQGFTGELLNSAETTWGYGESNGKKGYFPVEAVYVLPCVLPPKHPVLNLYKVS